MIQVSGLLGVVSQDKLILTQFNYDGLGPAAFFLAGVSRRIIENKHARIGSVSICIFKIEFFFVSVHSVVSLYFHILIF